MLGNVDIKQTAEETWTWFRWWHWQYPAGKLTRHWQHCEALQGMLLGTFCKVHSVSHCVLCCMLLLCRLQMQSRVCRSCRRSIASWSSGTLLQLSCWVSETSSWRRWLLT